MIKAANYLNEWWNRAILLFHDASVRTNLRWLVRLSVWAHHRLTWNLPEEWRLVDGMPLREYMLRHELEIARHQIRYFADYASELQERIFEDHRSRKKTRTATPHTTRSPP
jgi:hypothetical protein